MDTIECIRKRRSIRKYKSDPIPDDLLSEMLEVLRIAPSAANRQPWKFILVKNDDKRRQIVEVCDGQKFLAQAPVVIIGCGFPDKAWHGMGGDKSADSANVDLAIAIDHLTLAAAARGLGTCWIGAFREDCIKKIFQIPDDVKVVALTPLGYPADDDPLRDIEPDARKQIDDIICYETFS